MQHPEADEPSARTGAGDVASLSRDRKVRLLLQRSYDDARSHDLDVIDDHARQTGTWGTAEHRRARDARERSYDEARSKLESLSDDQLNRLLANA